MGLGAACQIATTELPVESDRLQTMRDKLEDGLLKAIPGGRVNARSAPRLPNMTNLFFEEIDANALILRLPGLMLSDGSACNVGAIEPSHVLQAIGLTRKQASNAVRISLGRMTQQEDIFETVRQIHAAIQV